MRDFSKMACSELAAYISTELTHYAVKAGILHDDQRMTDARGAVDALMNVAVKSKFTGIAGMRSNLPDYLAERER